MKAAKVLAAGLAIASSAAVVSANTDPNTNDVLALNYALQLEHLEAAYYTGLLAQFANSDFTAAGIPTSVRDYLILIQAHETAHVNALTNAITGPYASTAGAACSSYNFNTTASLSQQLATAIVLEDVGVGAYTAALNHISNTGVQQVAATIATIEARHAAFLRTAVGSATATPASNIPYSDATNVAYSPDQVVAMAGAFFPSASACPYYLGTHELPAVRPAGVATNTTQAMFRPTSATPSANPTYTNDQFTQDVTVLNYALTLELLESNFYETFNGAFTADQFAAAATANNAASQSASISGAQIVQNIELIRQHEAAHVSALQSLIAVRGQTAVTAGCYNWSAITTAAQFLAVADVLENTGTSAYDGAANMITDTGLQQIAASVATVEARHSAFLNQINGKPATNQDFMSGNFDNARNMTDIGSTVAGLPYVINQVLTNGGACPAGGSSKVVPFANGGNGNNGASGTSSGAASTSSGAAGTSSGASAPGGNGNGNSASFAAPAIVSAALAFVAALLF